jgi:hypothetical protein
VFGLQASVTYFFAAGGLLACTDSLTRGDTMKAPPLVRCSEATSDLAAILTLSLAWAKEPRPGM